MPYLLESTQADDLIWRNILTPINNVTDKASEIGKEAKQSVEELSRTAGRKLDTVRTETGAALHTAAASVRSAGEHSSNALGNFASGAANRLDATASMVEDHDLSDALTAVRRYGRKHLAGSLLAAAVFGFFVGTAFSRGSSENSSD